MKAKHYCSLLGGLSLVTAGFLFMHYTADAKGGADSGSLPALVRLTTSSRPDDSEIAVKKLRAAGPAGLKALSEVYSNQIARHLEAAGAGKPLADDRSWERIRTAFDAVGAQRDDYASQLFWYTDLESAKAAARESGRPILSLRLLGKLDEEYSCANSRFFRTTLYANARVSDYLRQHYILHWQSVRPVPRITIDMGDGRKIERTITGNSIHYILDADGNPVDALPGLYGAQAFLDGLARAEAVEQKAAKLPGYAQGEFVRRYHENRLAEIQRQWAHDLAEVSTNGSMGGISPVAVPAAPDCRQLEALTSDATWQAIAALHRGDAFLDGVAYNLIASKEPQPMLVKAMGRATSKGLVETPMMKLISNLQQSTAVDTVHNEYQLHSQIHEWFADESAPKGLDALNQKIYAELFLTPDSDPWLGLAPADRFSALDHGGFVKTTTR